jgi:UDPglucose--hexose-1-phosphate uridylyltransferase
MKTGMNAVQQSLRKDLLTGEYVIMSPSRGHRPGAAGTSDAHQDALGPERCPFCPGREDQIPPIRQQTGSDLTERPWHTRVFANKFPALDEGLVAATGCEGLYPVVAGRGVHEVIVETPNHDEDFHQLPVAAMEAVLTTYADRIRRCRVAHPDLHPTLFKNHGRKAGATLRHPHAQLIATPTLPLSVRHREARMRRYYGRKGRCMVCDIARHELLHTERVVWEDAHVVGFVPFAATVPHEIMIVARRHQSDLVHMTQEEVRSAAIAISTLAGALERILGTASYNLLVLTPSGITVEEPFAHWFIRLLPRYGVEAGFEAATGMRINSVLPEDSAAMLRDAVPHVLAA